MLCRESITFSALCAYLSLCNIASVCIAEGQLFSDFFIQGPTCGSQTPNTNIKNNICAQQNVAINAQNS